MDSEINYSSLMLKWSGLKESSVLELDKYNKIFNYLSNLKSDFKRIEYNLIAAEKGYLKGGFIDNDITFDKGKLKESYNILNNDYSNILMIIDKCEIKIKELNQVISSYESEYYFAKKAYYETSKSKDEVI